MCVCTVPLFLPYHYVTIHHTRTQKLTCITWYPGYTAQGTLCINGLVKYVDTHTYRCSSNIMDTTHEIIILVLLP